ncbi:Dual-specificity kinase, spindle pole body (SPB) duplication and spindle checkpoint function [Tulasnella sp. JGI-2019a]|nr:Dual-specificity kinase, spindle pole body (SPB) duplication and spindle checkpoint function [Tulasnella sp. JGI-2019a]
MEVATATHALNPLNLPADWQDLLEDSDDEKPSFLDQFDSPQKPTASSSAASASRPSSSSPAFNRAPDTVRSRTPPLSSLLSRTTSAAAQQQGRAFARVASVPTHVLHKERDRDSDYDQQRDEAKAARRYSQEGQRLEPQTPAEPATLRSRATVTATASRPTIPLPSANKLREFPSATPGLTGRYNSLAAPGSNMPLRRTSSSPITTPESDGILQSDKDTSPESGVLSPRISPKSQGSSSTFTSTRSRVMSGRLGSSISAPPVRGRKVVSVPPAHVADVIEESSEGERAITEGEREEEMDREWKAMSLGRSLEREREEERERERERELEREREQESDVDRELEREREMMERERARDNREGMQQSHKRPRSSLTEFDSAADHLPGDVSPTQREYGYQQPPYSSSNPQSISSRSRATSSSEHQQQHFEPQQAVQHHRAASALDNYPTPRLVSATRPQTFARPFRPGQVQPAPQQRSETPPDAYAEQQSRPKSRGAIGSRGDATNTNGATLRPPPNQGLIRQGSAPIQQQGGGNAHTGVAYAPPLRHRRTPSAAEVATTSSRLRTGSTIADERQQYRDASKENRVINGVTPSASATYSSQPPNYSSAGGYSSQPTPGYTSEAADGAQLRELTNRQHEERERDRAANQEAREKTIAQQQMQQRQQQQQVPHAQQLANSRKLSPIMVVQGKTYQRLDVIGKGGTSKVFRVLSPEGHVCAIKKVSLENADPVTIQGYRDEIALLKRLEGNKRIVRLMEFDASSKKHILMVMECGEIDLAKLLSEKQGEAVDYPWLTCYWQQMLQAVHVIHEEKIVHTDLKPANFLLVKGSLKLIDFGIAKAIANDTTNISRDSQIGTVNYMSPEAIQGTRNINGDRIMKLGRASDVWSLGCILYQMIYGHPPFYFLTLYQRLAAIPDPRHAIDFPAVAVPTLPGAKDPTTGYAEPERHVMENATPVPPCIINTMRNCLQRDPKQRPSVPDLLAEKWNMNPEPAELPRPSSPTPLLRPDEAIIDDGTMYQLMRYTLTQVSPDSTDEELKAKVTFLRQRLQQARRHS